MGAKENLQWGYRDHLSGSTKCIPNQNDVDLEMDITRKRREKDGLSGY